MAIIFGLLVLGFLAFLTLDALGRWALLAAVQEEATKRQNSAMAIERWKHNNHVENLVKILSGEKCWEDPGCISDDYTFLGQYYTDPYKYVRDFYLSHSLITEAKERMVSQGKTIIAEWR